MELPPHNAINCGGSSIMFHNEINCLCQTTNFIIERYGTASTHPHNCVQTSWHAEHFWFWKFRGRRFLIPSLIPLKCNVPMDTTRSPSVQRVASWCSWGRSQPGGRWFRQLTFITIYLGRAIYNIQVDRISNHMLFTHTISSRMTHKVLMCIHKHHHGTPSGCPHKRILHILATTSLPCPMIHSPGAHWVLTWCSLGAHLVLTWCSLGAHWVLIGCSLGAHWVLIDPTWQPGHDASTELHHSSQQWKTCISLQRGIKK